MLLAQSFIIDLKSEDSLILASNISDSIVEYSTFLASSSKSRNFTVFWKIYVISPSNEVFRIYNYNNDYSFDSLVNSLTNLKNMNFNSPSFTNCTEESKDPLETAITLCTIDFASGQNNFLVFMSSKKNISEEEADNLKTTLRTRKIAYPNAADPCFVVIGEQTDLCEQLSNISQTITFENEDDCYFMFFRSLVTDILFPASFDAIEIDENKRIDVQTLELFISKTEIKEKNICKCHELQTIQSVNQNDVPSMCQILKKKLNKTSITKALFLGKFKFPENLFNHSLEKVTIDDFELQDVYKVIGKIDTKEISQSFVTGMDKVMISNSPMFVRLLNEMRSSNESLIAKMTKSQKFGGEFFVIVADLLHPILHIKNIANRCQIVRFAESIQCFDEPEEICSDPILSEIKTLDNINPFILGNQIAID